MTWTNASSEIAPHIADAPCIDTECVALGTSGRSLCGISDEIDDRLRTWRETGRSPQGIAEARADGTLRHVFFLEAAATINRKHV